MADDGDSAQRRKQGWRGRLPWPRTQVRVPVGWRGDSTTLAPGGGQQHMAVSSGIGGSRGHCNEHVRQREKRGG
jgi:hypothetical protein